MTVYAPVRTLDDVLQEAFPEGLSTEKYYVVLAVMHPLIDHTLLVDALAHFTGKPYCTVYDDLMQAKASFVPHPADADAVQERLIDAGWFDWIIAEQEK